ncbi:hypothetical protein XPA_010589 [Xanthoria parietina]
MRIRRAVTSDFPKAASISVAAFAKDELYHYTNPYAGQQQSSFRGFMLRRLKLRNVLPGYITWVAVTTEIQDLQDGAPDQEVGSERGRRGEEPDETVIGYAVWNRHGKSAAARGWQTQSWAEWLESMLLKTQDTYVDFFQLDKSASPCNMRRLGAMGFFRDEFAEIPERWHLHNLVVDPIYQRGGVGAKLLSRGLEQAELEKVPTTLKASTVAEPLYRRIGFNTFLLMDLPGIRMGLPSLIRWPSNPENTEAGSSTG